MDIRLRKPCLFARLRLLGWNVRFTHRLLGAATSWGSAKNGDHVRVSPASPLARSPIVGYGCLEDKTVGASRSEPQGRVLVPVAAWYRFAVPTALPRPGWYPDPQSPVDSERWWDGFGWASHTRTTDGGSRPIPLRALWWALLGLAVGEVAGSVLALGAASATGTSVTSAGPELGGELGLWAGMLGAVLLVSRTYGRRSLREDFGLAVRPVDLVVGLAAAVTGLAVVQIVGMVLAGTRFAGSNTQILSGQKGNPTGVVIVTLLVAVGAPVFEELFFRGLIRTALASRLGRHGAVWGQAVLFGLAHLGEAHGLGNVSVVLSLVLLGVVLGYTALLTRRLGGGMVAHGLFNLTAAVVIFALH